MRERLIDEIVTELRDKNLLGEITHICLTPDSASELMRDYQEEFESEFIEYGRSATLDDVADYFGLGIVKEQSLNGKKYQLLKVAE